MNRILITGARAPAALHLARLFDACGVEVIMADTLKRPLAKMSSVCAGYFKLPPPDSRPHDFAERLQAVLEQQKPDLVIPTCEEVFYLAWAFENFSLASSLFAPSFAKLGRAHNKAWFAEDAGKFGLNPPETSIITSKKDLESWRSESRGVVFKPAWSRFAEAVLIRPGREELDHINPSASFPWIAQSYVPGEEACCYAIAREGRLLGSTTYSPVHRAGKGAGIYFAPVSDRQITRHCAAYVEATGWTGQIAFDFRRDVAGDWRILECNPRATSGVHFYGPRANLPGAILHGQPVTATHAAPLMIPAAMLLYGLPNALRRSKLADWWRDIADATDALRWPSDRLALFGHTRAVFELGLIALKERQSLQSASTNGIAWNGNPVGLPSFPALKG